MKSSTICRWRNDGKSAQTRQIYAAIERDSSFPSAVHVDTSQNPRDRPIPSRGQSNYLCLRIDKAERCIHIYSRAAERRKNDEGKCTIVCVMEKTKGKKSKKGEKPPRWNHQATKGVSCFHVVESNRPRGWRRNEITGAGARASSRLAIFQNCQGKLSASEDITGGGELGQRSHRGNQSSLCLALK